MPLPRNIHFRLISEAFSDFKQTLQLILYLDTDFFVKNVDIFVTHYG